MTKTKDGGPAFPLSIAYNPNTGEVVDYGCPGMSLRDWFAGLAMQGTVNYPDAPAFENAAKYSYQMADAMLEAREVKP